MSCKKLHQSRHKSRLKILIFLEDLQATFRETFLEKS